ncbi:partial Phosphomannomutase/phosphoglucomutase, partial [biofilm metagenome]
MERLFTIITATAIAMIFVAGVGVYVTSMVIVSQAKEDASQADINTVAQSVGDQINLLNKALDNVAQDADVIAAFANAADLKAKSSQLEKYIPEARKIRLLPIGTIEPDETNVPRMGYGDIDMVKATFQGSPLPAIQGDVGPDQHLAITRRVMQGNKAVGIILASLSYDFIGKALKEAAPEFSHVEIKQEKLLLAELGSRGDSDDDLISTKIPGTSWEIRYPDASSGGLGQGFLYFCLIFIPIALALGIFYICYRQLSVMLAQDQDWILTAFKDVLTNRPKGSYPVSLKGMNAVIASMVRFNLEVELQGVDALKNMDDEFELEGFFDVPISEVSTSSLAAETKKIIQDSPYQVEEVESIPIAKSPVNTEPQAVVKVDEIDPADAIFRAYDIRGIAGEALNAQMVNNIGKAFASEAKEKGCRTVVIGRDGRLSSPELADALAKGILSTGCHVLDVGMVPTPVLYFVAQHTDGRTGIMITGSHNPSKYNGLKMMMKGETLAGQRVKAIKQRIDNNNFVTGEGSIEQNGMFESEYIGTVCDDIQMARNMKVVLDCGNGVAGGLAPGLFKNLGCEVIELYCEVDGNFPNHHPDPSKPENLAALITAVKENQADVGFAFDGDGDRLGVVDSSGKIIWPDRQMMVFAKDVLAGKPGSEIIFDVKCSRHLPTQIVKYGGRPIMWKTGHSFMKAKLKETGAKLAGEMSGHIFFNDRWFGFDDALYAASRMLQILSEDDRPTVNVFADFPDSLSTPELNVELEEGENVKFIEKLFASAKFTGGKIIDIDGMRIDFSNGWGLVRASNTTPSLVIRFEADNKEALENIQAQFRDLM